MEDDSLFLSPVLFSSVFDGSFLLKDGTNEQVQPPGGFPQETEEAPKVLMPFEMVQLQGKMEMNICLKIEIKDVRTESNLENLISSYGRCGHFGWSGLT